MHQAVIQFSVRICIAKNSLVKYFTRQNGTGMQHEEATFRDVSPNSRHESEGARCIVIIISHLFIALFVNVLSLSAFLLLLSMSRSTLIVFFPPVNRSDLGATV